MSREKVKKGIERGETREERERNGASGKGRRKTGRKEREGIWRLRTRRGRRAVTAEGRGKRQRERRGYGVREVGGSAKRGRRG